jgi:hypothetical protein
MFDKEAAFAPGLAPQLQARRALPRLAMPQSLAAYPVCLLGRGAVDQLLLHPRFMPCNNSCGHHGHVARGSVYQLTMFANDRVAAVGKVRVQIFEGLQAATVMSSA